MNTDSVLHSSRISPSSLADHAVAALLAELDLFPKPGLVSPIDSGSHKDMDHGLLRVSAMCLHGSFKELAELGASGANFDTDLIPAGIRAERHMMQVTGGVNTHRGAIFTLGLLDAAAASLRGPQDPPSAIRKVIQSQWGPALQAHSLMGVHDTTHGSAVRRTSGAGGAREEAVQAFPSIFEVALPCYSKLLHRGIPTREAGIQTLFLLMSSVPDTNTLHRGGEIGAAHVMQSASSFLDAGGIDNPAWEHLAKKTHADFIARNLSPGGSADLLAGTLFVHAVTKEFKTIL